MPASSFTSQRSADRAGARWYAAVWRWHFYAGLFCIPFVIWLALTGTLYLWRPQAEALLDRPYDHLATAGPLRSPDAQVAAAIAAVPGATFHTYVLPEGPGSAVRVLVAAHGEDSRVYVDPRTLHVLKVVAEDRRPFAVVMRLHGELMAGAIGSYLVETAACWAVVMLITGLYLWWPRGKAGLAGVLYPRLRAGRRVFWRDMHATAGIWVSVCALGLILTGLPWASAWGSYLGEVRALTGTAEGPVDWTIGGKPSVPQADPMLGPHAGHQSMAAGAPPFRPGALGRVIDAVVPLCLAPPVLISAPAAMGAPWTATSDAADRPLRADVRIDGPTGRILGRRDFADRHWIDRAIGYGIAAHEGALFGIANQVAGTLTTALLVILSVSGAVLWWRRRPIGSLGSPPLGLRPQRSVAIAAAVVALGVAMPMFGLTLLAVLVGEATILRRMPKARSWLGLP